MTHIKESPGQESRGNSVQTKRPLENGEVNLGSDGTDVNAYERREITPKTNPLTLVPPEHGPEYHPRMGWVVKEDPLTQRLLELRFDSREIDLLWNYDTDSELAAVILIQRLGYEAAKELQYEIPATTGKVIKEDFVSRVNGDPKLLAMQRKYAFIQDFGGKVRVAWRDTEGAFRTRSIESFKQAHMNEWVDVVVPTPDGEKTSRKALADAWLYWPRRRTYAEARFLPGQRALPGLGILNLWDGWPVQMAAGEAEQFKHHLKEFVCGGDQATFDWVMGWLAHSVQKVHETPTTALVLSGPQGSGKNVIVKLLFEVFGRYTMMCTQSSQLVGNFNSHLMDKLFVFANEAFFAGNKKEANALKSLVTDETMVVEPKGVDAFQVKKHFRLILASNEERVVNLEIDDRRFAVLRADALAYNNDRDYFGGLIQAWREEGEREMFLYELYHWDLSSWDEGSIPETEARVEQRELSLSGPDGVVYDILCEGDGHRIVAHDPETGQVAVKAAGDTKWTKTTGKILRALGGFRTQINGHGRCWVLPDLGSSRAAYAAEKRVRADWEDLGHQWWSVPDDALSLVLTGVAQY